MARARIAIVTGEVFVDEAERKRYLGRPCTRHGEKEITSERYILGDKCVECDNRVQYRPTRRGMVSRARIGGPHDRQSIDNLKIARDTLDAVREVWE